MTRLQPNRKEIETMRSVEYQVWKRTYFIGELYGNLNSMAGAVVYCLMGIAFALLDDPRTALILIVAAMLLGPLVYVVMPILRKINKGTYGDLRFELWGIRKGV